MDKTVQNVLREFEKRADKEWELTGKLETAEFLSRLDEFLLPVGPATGQLINLLAKEAESKTIVEVGSSYGYSTVWLAEAARETSGKVISLEIHAGKQEYAREAIKKAGLEGFVDFKLRDAREAISGLKESIDFVLLDLWKELYIPCFDLLYPKLSPGALIVADNMIEPEFSRPAAMKYQEHVRAKPDIRSVPLSVGSGLELSRYRV